MSTLNDDAVHRLIALAKAEDFGSGDLSTELLPDRDAPAAFSLIANERGVIAGLEIAPSILRAYDALLTIEWDKGIADGSLISNPPHVMATLRGPLGSILSAERVLLNFLQRLSGVASLTHRFVEAVAGTGAVIFDTRKTAPGWRALDKYAVRCGGGQNHRMGLHDAVLIKDNHLAGLEKSRFAQGVFDLLNRLDRAAKRPAFVEVEADDIESVEQLFKVVGVDLILLDNFAPEQCRDAVLRRDAAGLRDRVALEVSGGITLDRVRAYAETGVERIAVGCLTHSFKSLDLKLDRIEC
ncbi:MAG: carboxylating nicotinate-nucleotide diphosphorylase [Planctomycetes bacterium]|nr:carboxylating nicotinate-nucleotide diphosphorylase [Planctomycetota bacterium]